MPLQDLLPQIDDRRFDDLVAEIRTRIARYAPEWRPGESAWTDVNDNDPGVTIAQVFAWQAEMLLYRMNLVPTLNYLKFLELIGLTLNAAEPARAEVTFPVKSTHPLTLVAIPLRTQLSADPGDGGPQLIFETTRAIEAWRASLDAVLVRDDITANYQPVTDLNRDAVDGFAVFGDPARKGGEVALGFLDPQPLPAGLLDLAVVVRRDGSAATGVSCANAPVFPPAAIKWEYFDGSTWTGLDLVKDETSAFTRSGHIHVKMPPKGISAQTRLEADPAAPLRKWIRARVDQSQYERTPFVLAIRTNTVAVEQAETIVDEVVGGSDGGRNQQFTLASSPVLRSTLRLEIEQSDKGFEPWQEVQDFYASGPRDDVYVLDRSTGTITTGDGVNGNIPVAYVRNPDANVVAREYRVGGGKRGNVGAGTIQTLTTRIDGVDDGAIVNLQPAVGGGDEETLDEATKRARRFLRSRERAVTAEDYEYFATAVGGVGRAKALPLFHPQFPDVPVPGAVSLIVVPDAPGAAPEPSEAMLRNVCACLEPRRTITAELFVLKPTYTTVSVAAELVVTDDADVTEVVSRVDKLLLTYFHPLTGGDAGSGWPFGGTIFYSKVYQRVSNETGVASITRLVLTVDDIEQPLCTDVPIATNALTTSVSHSVTASYRQEDRS